MSFTLPGMCTVKVSEHYALVSIIFWSLEGLKLARAFAKDHLRPFTRGLVFVKCLSETAGLDAKGKPMAPGQ